MNPAQDSDGRHLPAGPGLSAADVARLRADTPGASIRHHLNNAGSALPPSVVVDTVVAHLRREAEIGGYEAIAEASDQLEAVYASCGRLLNSDAGSISLTTSATDSWLRAFTSIPISAGDRFLISHAEYASNVLALLAAARRIGATVEAIPDDATGVVDVAALESMIDERVKIVAITHAPSQNGLLNPAEKIGAVLRKTGTPAWFVLDACQSIGQLPMDASAIGADFITATGRKFLRGPRGTGFLWSSPRARELEPGLIDLVAASWTGADAYSPSAGRSRFENYEKPYAALLGMGAAADYALAIGLAATRERICDLAELARTELARIPGVRIADRGSERTGIVTFALSGWDAADLTSHVKASGVNVSYSPRAYAVRDFDAQGINGLVRASPHVYNDDEDIASLLRAVSEAARVRSA